MGPYRTLSGIMEGKMKGGSSKTRTSETVELMADLRKNFLLMVALCDQNRLKKIIQSQVIF